MKISGSQADAKRQSKLEWQRQNRREFAAKHGYSSAANYACGGNRAAVLERDNHACVKCGMTADEHLERWSRPITVDHKDKNRKNNSMENLQTLCLSCHGRKDLLPQLRVQRIPKHKSRIIKMRKGGSTYQQIADE